MTSPLPNEKLDIPQKSFPALNLIAVANNKNTSMSFLKNDIEQI
jgi:hypothetical protein